MFILKKPFLFYYYILIIAIIIIGSFFIASYPLKSATISLSPGQLIKAESSNIYFLGSNLKRYVFPTEDIYYSWYEDFSGIVTVPDSVLSQIPLGGSITYRPGSRLIRIESLPQLYFLDSGNILREVSEERAAALYGENWERRVAVMPVTFWVEYRYGISIEEDKIPHPDKVVELASDILTAGSYAPMGGRVSSDAGDSVISTSTLTFIVDTTTSTQATTTSTDTVLGTSSPTTSANTTSSSTPVNLPTSNGGGGGGSSGTGTISPADTTPPVISNLTASNVTAARSTISWQTDESATAALSYGTSQSNMQFSTSTATFSTSTSLLLTGLSYSTTYYYQVTVTDSSGNSQASTVDSFTTRKPNIALIVLDDIGYGDLGAYGGTYIQTPRIDEFATEGMKFTEFYATPLCSPTRAAILTSRYPASFDIRRVCTNDTLRGIPIDAPRMPQQLRLAGYTTGHFGKWHLGTSSPEFLPTGFGFDEDAVRIADSNGNMIDNGSYFDSYYLINDQEPWVATTGHITEVTTDYAINFITNHQGEPFFMNLWYNSAHIPWEPVDSWAQVYPDRGDGGSAHQYAAMISHLDEQIGRVLDTLNTLGIDDSTLVVIVSDNGGGINHKGSYDSNGGLRGHKIQMFEGGIKVPMIARWPGIITAGTSNSSVATVMDFFPTFTDIAGRDVSSLALEGKNIINAFTSDTVVSQSATLFWENKEANKYFAPASGELNSYAVRNGNWKLVKDNVPNSSDSIPQLYDIVADPYETTDLAASNQSVVDSLLAEYRAWRQRIGLISHTIASTEGNASLNGTTLTFNEGTDGAAVLARDTRFNFNDVDFSFQTNITPVNTTTTVQTIAEYPNSWSLSLNNDGTVELVVHEQGTALSTTLTSTTALDIATHNIAFTIFGWKNSNSTIRLYIDGTLEQETNAIDSVSISSDHVILGNNSARTQQFVGTIENPKFYLMSLTADEVLAGM